MATPARLALQAPRVRTARMVKLVRPGLRESQGSAGLEGTLARQAR